MDKSGFENMLQQRGLTAEQISQQLAAVEEFEVFLNAARPPRRLDEVDAEETQAYVDKLIAIKRNSYDSLLALARYGRLIRNDAMLVAVLELLDGSEALEGLHRKLGEVAGAAVRDQIFAELPLPPLGIPNVQKARITRVVMERIQQTLDDDTCQKLFSGSFRDLPDEYTIADRERYQEIGNFDRFLELKREEFIAQLEHIRDEGGLFFSQEITDEVVEFVRADPEISQGVRQGNILYVTKIPYLASRYLAENDPELKRYYYCHCPWARESLRHGETAVSAKFCQCSAGFHKKSWEVIFGQPLQADVLESVLQGDMRCRFAIHLPQYMDELPEHSISN